MKNSILAIFSLMVIMACSKHSAPLVSDQNPTHSFVVYNQIHYNHTPVDLTGYGIKSSIIHYPKSFLDSIPGDPTHTGNPNSDCKVINASKLAALATADAQGDPKVPVILDIESWSYAPAKIQATVDSFQKVITLYRQSNPKSPIGFYGGIPQNRWEWKNVSSPTQLQNWQQANAQLAPIVPNFQYFAPDLYNYGATPDTASWVKYAKALLREVKRYNSGKPAYAFVSPQCISSGQFIAYDIWHYELTQLYNIGFDGVIIWSSNLDSNGKRIDFQTATLQGGWWNATQDFLKEKKITAQ